MPDSETCEASERAFLKDVVEGLSAKQKTLPCYWLYDERGSELFEEITQLPEYYVTRTEQALLDAHMPEIADKIGPDAVIVEYGSGASVKTRRLLNALQTPSLYVPTDISEEFLTLSAEALRLEFPALDVQPHVANFMSGGLDVTAEVDMGMRLGFFPGSTIGNLSDVEIKTFLGQTRKKLGSASAFLLGVDLTRDPAILIPAYADAAGVTAAFNLNILTRINRELEGNFDLHAFRHEARWNVEASRVEMHLVCLIQHTVRIDGVTFHFEAGESIHTENSRKFTAEQIAGLAAESGWAMGTSWTDASNRFGLFWLEAT